MSQFSIGYVWSLYLALLSQISLEMPRSQILNIYSFFLDLQKSFVIYLTSRLVIVIYDIWFCFRLVSAAYAIINENDKKMSNNLTDLSSFFALFTLWLICHDRLLWHTWMAKKTLNFRISKHVFMQLIKGIFFIFSLLKWSIICFASLVL